MKRRKYDRHTCSKNQNMLYQICPAWHQSASTSIHVYSPPDKALELSNVSCLAQLPLFFGTVIGWIQVDIYAFPSAPPCCQKVTHINHEWEGSTKLISERVQVRRSSVMMIHDHAQRCMTWSSFTSWSTQWQHGWQSTLYGTAASNPVSEPISWYSSIKALNKLSSPHNQAFHWAARAIYIWFQNVQTSCFANAVTTIFSFCMSFANAW